MQKIRYVSRGVAERLPAHPDWVVISIFDKEQGYAALQDGWADVLRLEFLDIDSEAGDGPLFNREMAGEILQFAEKAHAGNKSILVHCHAGLSRSAAVAIFLGSLYQLEVYADTLRLHAAYGLYNKHVYRTLSRVCQGYD